MATKSDTGYAASLDNFNSLGNIVEGFGAVYNPSKPALALTNLRAVYTTCSAAHALVANKEGAYRTLANERRSYFTDFKERVTRIYRAVKSSNVKPETIENSKSYVKKLRGGGSKKKADLPEDGPPPETTPRTHSTSQMSFVMIRDNFVKWIELLRADGGYKPNEEAFTLASLDAIATRMSSYNDQVDKAFDVLSTARSERYKVMTGNPDSLLNLQRSVKDYTLQIFGSQSKEYGKVRGLSFRH